MRTLLRFLSLLLCFELIVSPIAPNMSLIAQNARAEDCPTGFSFDSVLNRCLTKAETANVMNATMSCGQDVQCYKENAQKAFQDKVNAGEAPERKGGGGFLSKVTTIAAVAGPVTYVAIGMKDSAASCMSPSFYAMVAGAAALVIGDNLANMQHKKRLKKIKEDWGKIVNPEEANGDKDKERETSINAQSEAFEKLAQAEDSLAKAAKMKQKFFMVATLAYGASTVMALMEKKKSQVVEANLNAATAQSATSSQTAAASSNPVAPTLASIQASIKANKEAQTALNKTIETQTQQAAAAQVNTQTVAGGSTTSQTQGGAKTNTPSAMSSALQAKKQASVMLSQAQAGVKAANASVTAAQANASAFPQNVEFQNALRTALKAQADAQQTLVAAQAYHQDKEQSLCTEMGAKASFNSVEQNSLYSYYTSGSQSDLKGEIQAWYNLENSQDMAAFEMNKRELLGKKISADEYLSLKSEFSEIESIDNSIFEIFKATSLGVLNHLNPIASAHADEAVQSSVSESSESAGGGASASSATAVAGQNSASSASAGVNSNAAKAFKDDEGKGFDFMSIGIGVGVGYLLAVKSGLREKLLTPTGRAVFSGVMAGLTFMMSQHAGSQAEASEKRAELLRKMKEEFKSASGAIYACKSEDRNDPGKPNCYCYTAENARNNARSNSQVCQKLWAGVNTNINPLASGTGSTRVCVTQNRQADATCSCRQTNSCMKVSLGAVKGLDMGSMSVLGNGITPLNKVMDGSIDGANLDAATLGSQAAKLADLAKKIENTKGMEDYKKNKGALETKLKADLARGAASLPGGSMLGGSSGSGMPSNPGQAATMLEKELAEQVPTGVGGADDFVAAPAPQSENLEFGMTGDQLAAQEGQIAEVMNKDLDYGANDINEGSKTNIFEVLSNRYQRSGMRRLFDEKGETKPEAASKSDITQ